MLISINVGCPKKQLAGMLKTSTIFSISFNSRIAVLPKKLDEFNQNDKECF